MVLHSHGLSECFISVYILMNTPTWKVSPELKHVYRLVKLLLTSSCDYVDANL